MLKLAAITLWLCLAWAHTACWAAATYDADCSNWINSTGPVTCSLTIGSNSDRAVQVQILTSSTSLAGITVTVGGNSLSAVSGSDSTTTYALRAMTYCATTSLTGSQTVSVNYTGSAFVVIGAISAYNVDQTTPCNNGTFTGYNANPGTTHALNVTTTTGDLTAAASQRNGSGTYTIQSPSTVQWNQLCCNVGGTGTDASSATHTFESSTSGNNMVMTGANFKQVSASSGACTLMLLAVGSC